MIVFVRLLPLVLGAVVLNLVAPTSGAAPGLKPKAPIEIVPLTGHDGSVRTVAFSPDRARVLTGGWDQTARLWDAASGALLRTFEGHAAVANSAGWPGRFIGTFSPNFSTALSGMVEGISGVHFTRP